MSDPLENSATTQQMARVSTMLRGKHTPEAIAAATGLSVQRVQAIARLLAPKAKAWKGRRR